MDLECIECKFDGTHSNIANKEKLHVSVFTSTAVVQSEADALPVSAPGVKTAKITGELQTVHFGTGSETYLLVKNELRSVGISNWEERVQEAQRLADPIHGRVSVFCFGTDAGPDNIGMTMRVRRAVYLCLTVMFIWVFCMFHQGHLVSMAMIKATRGTQKNNKNTFVMYFSRFAKSRAAKKVSFCGLPF